MEPLKNHTTLRIGGPARYWGQAESVDDLKQIGAPFLILGGGSNVLVADDGWPGLAIEINLRGVEDLGGGRLRVAAGEVWDEFVALAVNAGLWGVENMSFIPGKVGGAPIQNIGAYGQQASDVVESVEVLDTSVNEIKVLGKDECGFGYRKSIFNSGQKGKYVVLSVTFVLQKNGAPNLTYPDLQKRNCKTLAEIRSAVIEIRKNKGFDPSEHGTAGSFFKNLVLNDQEFEVLREHVYYGWGPRYVEQLLEVRGKFGKVPTAFIMDKLLNLKGAQVGGAVLSDQQVLNIINTGEATAEDVMTLFKKVRREILSRTGMVVTNEPELVGFSQKDLDFYFSLDD